MKSIKRLFGSDNARWKGGRHKCKRTGYVKLSGQWDNPNCHPTSGSLLEHRVVMEKHLGRYLTKSETVHHRNGIRDDNRIENLELWCKPPLAGQRAWDIVDWVTENYPEECRIKLEIRDITRNLTVSNGDKRDAKV